MLKSGSVESRAAISGGYTSHAINGLVPGTTYTVSVMATNDAGSTESNSVQQSIGKRIFLLLCFRGNLFLCFLCAEIPVSVAPPSNSTLTVQSATVSTISLTWSVLSSSAVDDYELEWRSGAEINSATIPGGTCAYTVRDLNSATSYTIVVTASNPAGRSQSNTVHAHVHAHAHTYTHTHAHAHAHAHTQTHTHTHSQIKF